jgi:hypothetical protein
MTKIIKLFYNYKLLKQYFNFRIKPFKFEKKIMQDFILDHLYISIVITGILTYVMILFMILTASKIIKIKAIKYKTHHKIGIWTIAVATLHILINLYAKYFA